MDDEKNSGHCILLLAGCKVGGQCGINKWFFSPENLAKLAVKYSTEYFQILLKIKYNYVEEGTPIIKSVNILKEEIIDCANLNTRSKR